MKEKLIIPNISNSSNKQKDFEKVLKLSDYHHIDQYPWGKTDEFQKIRFKIAHNNKNIYLYYDVTEPEMMAKYSNHNDPVCKDSCVEFFIAFEKDANYYNFEFNSLGTCLLAWGPDRYNRQLLDTKKINLIKVKTKIKRVNKNGLTLFNWKTFIKIPLKTFSFSSIKSLENIKARANFYKCGDDLSKPHYITWNTIKSEKPDFHLKSYFGDIEFD
ncbi:carbohydrate-binding family 9-like protein [Mariniflexile litorale]|uniref:Carbohydrate-binding family 9-like protein n=1 Tax=Mariniflexile litorale TaxID=3045158 RepID=A0AAU7EFL3_9FLAO|nr:carbohydrate-binding family 9-like protein [Mariniflexile sp. KMM 9835]MDQ8209962.1 carbohydrate-binding family 9-like protein [Mariniflexile sp. KMM 9835]